LSGGILASNNDEIIVLESGNEFELILLRVLAESRFQVPLMMTRSLQLGRPGEVCHAS